MVVHQEIQIIILLVASTCVVFIDSLWIKRIRRMRQSIVDTLSFRYEKIIIEFILSLILRSTNSMRIAIKILDNMAHFSKVAKKIIIRLNNVILSNTIPRGKKRNTTSLPLPIRQQLDNDFIQAQVSDFSDTHARELEALISMMDSLSEKLEDDISIFLFAIFFLPIVLAQIFVITKIPQILIGLIIPQIILTLLLMFRLGAIRKEIETR